MLGAQNSPRPGQSVYCGLALEEEVVLDIAEDVFLSSIKLGWKNQSHPGSASQFTSVYGMLIVSGEFLLLYESLNSGVNSKFSSENQICLAG